MRVSEDKLIDLMHKFIGEIHWLEFIEWCKEKGFSTWDIIEADDNLITKLEEKMALFIKSTKITNEAEE